MAAALLCLALLLPGCLSQQVSLSSVFKPLKVVGDDEGNDDMAMIDNRSPRFSFGLGKRSTPGWSGQGEGRWAGSGGAQGHLPAFLPQPWPLGILSWMAMVDPDQALTEPSEKRGGLARPTRDGANYGFGLGKRSFSFGLGKRDQQYHFGLGKRNNFGFGLGK